MNAIINININFMTNIKKLFYWVDYATWALFEVYTLIEEIQ